MGSLEKMQPRPFKREIFRASRRKRVCTSGLQDFESAVLRGARRTLRTAHPITSSLSDAASNCTTFRTPLDRSCLLSPACPTVGLFGFFFRPGKDIFPLAVSTACSELHDGEAGDQPEVPHVGSQHGVANFQ